MCKVDGIDNLWSTFSLLFINLSKQIRCSLEKILVEALALRIPTWSAVVSAVTWDRSICYLRNGSKNPDMPHPHIWSLESGDGKFLASLSVMRPYSSQLALRKFKRFCGALGTVITSLAAVISEGQCYDRGNLLKMRLSRNQFSWPTLAKARSGLIAVSQQPEKNLGYP